MSLTNTLLTADDFRQTEWQAVIVECDTKACHKYEHQFAIRANLAATEGNTKTQEVFTLLRALSSLSFRLDDKKCPLVCAFELRGVGRSAMLGDIGDAHLDVLKEIVIDVDDADMCARIADALWIRRRGNYQHVELAISSYLASAKVLLNANDEAQSILRIERALQLALQINNRDHIRNVVEHINDLVDEHTGTSPTFIQTKMLVLLHKYRQGDPVRCVTIAGSEAERMEAAGATEAARMFWEIKEGWHAADETQAEELRQTRVRIAETYVNDANLSLACTPPDYNSAKYHLVQAIEAFRRCSGCQAQVDGLHHRLLECQQKATIQMGRISVPFDPSSLQDLSRQAVKGLPLIAALRELGLLSTSPNVAQIRAFTEDTLRNSILSIIPMEIVNEQGKTVAKSPSADTDDETEAEKVIRNHMFQKVMFHYSLVTRGQVQPALEQITLEHHIRIDDLLPLLRNNPFIPPEREFLYAKGLYAGLMGEWVEAVHILIPQLENSIRYVLTQSGAITSGLDSEAIQDEYDLNRTLRMDETKDLLGDDLVFDLRGLLIERWGVNFRNRMAHGLFDSGAFYSESACYVWWITLRMCVVFMLGFVQALRQAQTQEAGVPQPKTSEQVQSE